MSAPMDVRAVAGATMVVAVLAVTVLAGCAARRPAPAPDPLPHAVPAGDAAATPPSPATTVAPAPAQPAPIDAAAAAQPEPPPPSDPAPPAAPPAAGAPLPRLADGRTVFAALRAQLATRACVDDRVVQRWIATYARAPARLAANLERVLPLLAWVLEQVRERSLPGEFALLPIVESWYRIDARNGATAGLWQFSTRTARGNGLTVGDGIDERYSPAAATDAALLHLQALQHRFGDWRLAVMAFNAGEYRLAAALRSPEVADRTATASPAAHQPPGLSLTTYEHLARLLALACLVQAPERVGMQLPDAPFEPLQRGGPRMAAAPAPVPAADGSGLHEVRRGDSLWAIARRYRASVAQLVRWNGLARNAVLQPGQRLRVRP